jgi:hypothetical protein
MLIWGNLKKKTKEDHLKKYKWIMLRWLGREA